MSEEEPYRMTYEELGERLKGSRSKNETGFGRGPLLALRDRIAELEAALKPFAEAVERCDGKDDWEFVWRIKIGDLRAARAALKGENSDK